MMPLYCISAVVLLCHHRAQFTKVHSVNFKASCSLRLIQALTLRGLVRFSLPRLAIRPWPCAFHTSTSAHMRFGESKQEIVTTWSLVFPPEGMF